MKTWWLNWVRKFLQTLLTWIDQIENRVPRRTEAPSILAREVHVPTPAVAAVVLGVLFMVLAPETGLQPMRLLVLLGLLLLLAFFFVVYFRYELPQFVNDDEAVFLTGVCIIFGVLLIQIGRAVPRIPAMSAVPFMAIPLGAIAILVTLLLHLRLALLMDMVLAIIAGILNPRFSFDAMVIVFFSTSAAMLAAQKVRHRGDITRAGFHVAWVTFVTVYGLHLFEGGVLRPHLMEAGWALVNGTLCALIPLALLPILESFFSRITPITLLEVGDFNRPLLKRMMLEAPGTYHHTLLVSALAEQAAEAIGANSLLCRVGMYYHDVGKLLHPEYFIENQTMRRSAKDKAEHHDKLNPSISSLVIMSHVKDGIALARAHKVPDEVLKFIPEHHGTSLIKYFYMRALEQDEEGSPSADSFRYPGPRPRSRETVIGMLADSVEAASRTLEEPSYERLRDLVEKIVNSKFVDGQFDNSPVTLQDLRKIINSFAASLSAIHHVRIEYPEFPNAAETANLLGTPPQASAE